MKYSSVPEEIWRVKVRGKTEKGNVAEDHLHELQCTKSRTGGLDVASFAQFCSISLSPLCSVFKPLFHKSN